MRLRSIPVLVLMAVVAALATGCVRERFAEQLSERLAPPAVAATPLGTGERITRPGRYRVTLRYGGRDRFALIHVPAVRPTPAPLVMAVHGGGGSAAYQADDASYGLISKSEEAGFIVVFPNGTTRRSNGMFATWNAGRCCAQARDQDVDDTGFLRAVIADVMSRIGIDPRRVYAIGMSNGAMMAYRLACEAADVIRGIMAVAGTDNTRACAPSRPVAVLHVHARDDDRVLFEGGAGKKFRRQDVVADFTSVPDTIERWVQLDRAAVTARRVLAVPGAWCDRHDAGPGGAPVQLCVTDTGGHSWPGGGKARAAAAPSQAIRANEVMWEFFSSL